MEVLGSTLRQGRWENILTAISETETRGKFRVVFLGIPACFGKKDSSFYDLPWGRGVLVFMTGFGGGWGVKDRQQRDLGSKAVSEVFDVLSSKYSASPHFGVPTSRPQHLRRQLWQHQMKIHMYTITSAKKHIEKKKTVKARHGGCTRIIPGLRRLRQEACEFESSLCYTAGPRPQ
jgi:hypothetical protein